MSRKERASGAKRAAGRGLVTVNDTVLASRRCPESGLEAMGTGTRQAGRRMRLEKIDACASRKGELGA
ncbi:hypothetical protein GCM10007301_49560 [Azorhizobium oxalatiphilum]|uniref:Uncharacterized protein n=1 Tax=Azorhizobium oxalatiphilum TaxID=980631 RepID=A0A917CBU6_9HYPH|nr:hypothetical protein GCM10007301_49560 [Azorhizobium oxalatiphilum]